MTTDDLLAVLLEHGALLESAKGPVPNVAELVVGEPITGSWWGHPDSHAVFDEINALADHPDVLRTRLVNGKVTLVHRRLWASLVRLSDQFPADRLVVLHEEHTASGRHRVTEQPFGEAVPADVGREADGLTVAEAVALLPDVLRPPTA
jgi:hypothetical protein